MAPNKLAASERNNPPPKPPPYHPYHRHGDIKVKDVFSGHRIISFDIEQCRVISMESNDTIKIV